MESLIEAFDEVSAPITGERARRQRRGILGRKTLRAIRPTDGDFFDFMDPMCLVPARTINDRSEHPNETHRREQQNSIFYSSEMQNVLDPTKVLGTQTQDIASSAEVLSEQQTRLPIDPHERELVLSSSDTEALRNAHVMRSSRGLAHLDRDARPRDDKVHNRVAASYNSVARRGIDTENGYHAAQLERRHAETMRTAPGAYAPLGTEALDNFEGYRESRNDESTWASPREFPKAPHGDRMVHKRRRVRLLAPGETIFGGNVAHSDQGDDDSPLCQLSPGQPAGGDEVLQSGDLCNMNVDKVVDEFTAQQLVGFMATGADGADGRRTVDQWSENERLFNANEEAAARAEGPSSLFMSSFASGMGGRASDEPSMRSSGTRAITPYKKVYSTDNTAFGQLLRHIKARPQTECGEAYYNLLIRSFTLGNQSGYIPKEINTDAPRCLLPVVSRELEEYCMRGPLPRELECRNQDQCQGFKVGHGRGFVLVSLNSAIATRGPTVPEDIQKAMTADICILCRRYLVMIGCVAAKTSAIKNARPNYTVSTWVNIVGKKGEYTDDDCEMPCGNGYDGIYGPLARHGYYNYELGIMSLHGHQVRCYIQTHTKPTLDQVANF